MENYSDDGKKSSRRRFTSSIMAAIAALPFMHLQSNAQNRAKKKNRTKPQFITHDTPPPIIIEDGSLEIHTRDPLVLAAPSAPYFYTSQFGGTTNISHIRILDQNGTSLYYEPRAKGSTLKVQLQNEDGTLADEITVTGGSAIQVRSRDRRLAEHPNHKPNAFRKHQCEHPGRGNQRFRIGRIEVLNAPHTFVKDATSHAEYFSEEYRIMIWLEA